jgi:ankyrin repeat protein
MIVTLPLPFLNNPKTVFLQRHTTKFHRTFDRFALQMNSSQNTLTQLQALFHAIETNNIKTTTRLLNSYGFLSILPLCNSNGSTALHIASKIGSVDMFKLLLSYNCIDIDKLEDKLIGGCGAIHHLCSYGHEHALSLLIRTGGSINLRTQSDMKETALHICCKLGLISCARVLCYHNADLNPSDGFGHNPSFWAYSLRHFDMISALGLPSPRTATPLEHLASIGGNLKSLSSKPKKKKGKGKGKK